MKHLTAHRWQILISNTDLTDITDIADLVDITDLTDTTLLCIIHRKDGTLWQEEENHVF